MRRELSKLVKRQKKDYGIVIRRLGRSGRSKDGPTLGPALEAYKVYRDGREERMRNAEFNSFGPGPFKDIVAVAKKTFVHNTIYSSGGHSAAVSIVLPEGILFEDITIRPPSGEILKPPVAGHPFFNELASVDTAGNSCSRSSVLRRRHLTILSASKASIVLGSG